MAHRAAVGGAVEPRGESATARAWRRGEAEAAGGVEKRLFSGTSSGDAQSRASNSVPCCVAVVERAAELAAAPRATPPPPPLDGGRLDRGGVRGVRGERGGGVCGGRGARGDGGAGRRLEACSAAGSSGGV